MKLLLAISFLLYSLSADGQSRLRDFLEAEDRAEMKSLDLSRCKLDSLPQALSECHNLVELDLSKNDLSELPSYFQGFTKLEILHLSKNQFKSIPRILKACPNLKELHIDQNPVDSLNSYINGFQQLEYLDLWDCELKYISLELCKNQSLKKLDLRRNFVGTRDLEWLYKCLKEVEIESTWGCDCD